MDAGRCDLGARVVRAPFTLVVMAIVNVFVVDTLAWVVMPLLTRVFAGWLHKAANGNQKSNP